jgi:hypothetical protein
MGQDSTIQIQKQQLFTGEKSSRWSDLAIVENMENVEKSDRSLWK